MKKLDQSVFAGAPEWAEWACVDGRGSLEWHQLKPIKGIAFWYRNPKGGRVLAQGLVGATDWQNSLIRRDRCNDCPNKTDGVCCGQAV